MGSTMANPDLRRKIKVRMRPDLRIEQQRHGGQTFHIVKDPLGLRYFRFREEELFLLRQFDGHNTLDDIRHLFVERFRPQRISVQELEKFVAQLLQAGIATADTPRLGQRLYERHQKKKRDRIKQLLLNVLYIKVPVFDPDRLLNAILPYTRFLFTVSFFLCAIALWAASGLLILMNWDAFIAKLPSYHEFFTWRNLIYFWCTLGVVKVLHEFGHGLSCRKFGGEVHEMGFLVLVLSPCLYCNVTDAWMLPNKWHRVVIGAAGMYIELIVSSIFVWVWWYTEPGLLNTLSLSIIFISSVSTVIFNANPLLRFDGYYILSDFLEIPNLRERANKYLGNVAGKVMLGTEVVEDPYAPTRLRWFFILYAIAAYLYRWIVTIGILYFLYTFLKPYRLGSISAILGTLAAITLFVLPVWQIVKLLRNRWRGLKVKTARLVSSFATATAILAAILLLPLPMRLDLPLILQPEGAATVFVQGRGILDEIRVRDGEAVTAGTVLATLRDTDLEIRLNRHQLEQQQFRRGALSFRAMGQLAHAREYEVRAGHAGLQVENLRREQDKLQILAPMDGTVMLPPKLTDLGTTMSAGQVFCQIGDPSQLEGYVVVDHSDTGLVQPGMPVWVKLSGHVGEILKGTIERISTTPIDQLPMALSNKAGGEVATTTDSRRQVETPLFKSYHGQIPIVDADRLLVPGIRGLARIDVGYRSIFWRVKRYLQQTFHFRM